MTVQKGSACTHSQCVMCFHWCSNHVGIDRARLQTYIYIYIGLEFSKYMADIHIGTRVG